MSQSTKPRLVNVSASNLYPTKFREWCQFPNTKYIGSNFTKYTGMAQTETPWTIPSLEYKKYSREIDIDQYLKEYYIYLKKNKLEDIRKLKYTTLGCFCTNPAQCHGTVIQTLYKELEEEDEDRLQIDM